MEEKYKHKIITIPNILSLFRLLLIPVIMWLYIVKKDPLWTTAILVLSGVTDVVDGIIARKCHMISDFGKAFDPVADKLTQIAMLFCLVSRFKLKLLHIRVHVSGLDKIPTDTKVLFVSNHRSNFDPIVTWHAFKKWKIAFVSKPSNFKIPFFGRIIRKCCFMPIDRENPRNAIVTINKAATLLRKQEVSIGVYPEGTRSKNGELLPFHNGVFKIAQKAEKPMVVLCITGTEKIAKQAPFKPTDVYLDVLEVFSGENIKDTKTELIGTAVRQLIITNTERRDT